MFQVWFQNRRAKFRKQERLAQQKASQTSSSGGSGGGNSTSGDGVTGTSQQQVVKNESGGGKQSGGGSAVSGNPGGSAGGNKDVKPGTPTATVSTTPSSVSSNSNDVKPMNGNGKCGTRSGLAFRMGYVYRLMSEVHFSCVVYRETPNAFCMCSCLPRNGNFSLHVLFFTEKC
jgi:hypothetical protein